MNNYQKFINNFMDQYSNNNSFSNNNVDNNLYDDYQGFIRGNMFKNLYDPYKIQQPYEIKPMNEQADLLTHIDALTFAMTDLQLYLDTHPTDRGMISLFNKYRKEKIDRVKDYESKYGPLTIDSDSIGQNSWEWIDEPWPWQG